MPVNGYVGFTFRGYPNFRLNESLKLSRLWTFSRECHSIDFYENTLLSDFMLFT